MKKFYAPRTFITLTLLFTFFLIHVSAAFASPALAPSSIYTVNSNLDTDDSVCDATNCTLREAINAANANANADTIEFNLGSGTPTIAVGVTGLPTITQPVTINGNTGGATRVELNGTGTPSGIDGLKITGGSTTIRHLVINRFGGDGIEMNTNGSNVVEDCYIGFGSDGATLQKNADGIYILNSSNNTIGGTTSATRNIITSSGDGIFLEATTGVTTGNVIQGNYIGTDVGGTLARGTNGNGMSIYYADSNTIGGTASGAGNVIVDASGVGIEMFNADSNFIQGNIIGLAANGNTDLGNDSEGIQLSDSLSNTIGGTTHTANTCDGACNVISGNDAEGITLVGVSTNSNNNLIQGNFIGTDKNGTADRGNTDDGIWIPGGTGNTIGGTSSGAGNLISGNNRNGIQIQGNTATSNVVQGNYIGTNANGTGALGNSVAGIYVNGGDNNTIGGTTSGARNIISGNSGDGIDIQNTATGNTVQGNYIGTDASGANDLGNAFDGMYIDSASNTIGGTNANVISGNNQNGIQIAGNAATSNSVQGNYIGTNAAGTGALGNSFAGIYVNGGDNNTIGGTSSSARNIISGNFGDGIDIQNTATGNSVQGNYIGTNASGASDLGNTYDGIYIDSASNTLGGTASGAGNVISGNNNNGITIRDAAATNNQVIGNYIGTNASGTGDLGNTYEGVFINNAPNNTIGGTTSAHRNVISGNNEAGIDIFNTGATGNMVQGNYIGTQSDGTSALANSLYGVWIEGSASNNTIGGTASGAGNVIAFNASDGVFVDSGTGNQIRRNSIFSNDGLGIDLGANGVTANDTNSPPDSDTGANNLQNFPALTTVMQGSTIIAGSFNSTPNTSFTLEFFSSPSADASGNGEAKTFLCDSSITTNGSGTATINVTCATTTAAGHVVTATATRNSAPFDTSEFSNGVSVTPTAATVTDFSAEVIDARVQVHWTTGSELNVIGFNVWRRQGKRAELQLNTELIPAQNPGELIGSEYVYADANVRAGKKYAYRLEVVLANGAREWLEPIQIKIPKDANACAGKPKRVQLSSPQNGEMVDARQVALDWDDVKCATSYTIVIRKGDAQGKIVEQVEGVTTSEYVTKQLKRGETYFWNVRACNAAGCGKARGGTFAIRP